MFRASAGRSGLGDMGAVRHSWSAVAEKSLVQSRRARRPEATYDLTLKLIDRVKGGAEHEDVAQSDIVAWALTDFLERYADGGVVLDEHKKPTKSLRVTWKLELSGKWQ